MSENLNTIFSRIDLAIKNADFMGALKEVFLLKPIVEKYFEEVKNVELIKEGDKKTDYFLKTIFNYGGFLIDCGSMIKDEKLLDEGIFYTKNLFNRVTMECNRSSKGANSLVNRGTMADNVISVTSGSFSHLRIFSSWNKWNFKVEIINFRSILFSGDKSSSCMSSNC